MTAIGPTSNDAAYKRLRESEQELWRYYGLQDVIKEKFVPLRSHPALLGVKTARVCILEAKRDHDTNQNSRTPLVFVHGGGGMVGDWAHLLPHLARDRRIVLLERPGNGLSEPVDYSRCDLGEFSECYMEEVLYALGIAKAHLVGNSLGGGTVLWYAFAQERKGKPEKVASVSVLGVPAGFQGMMFAPQIVCWLANLWVVREVGVGLAPYIPFLPFLVMCVFLNIPYRSITSAYLKLTRHVLAIHHNGASFLSILKPLWDASRNGKGWKLTNLKSLSHSIPVLMAEGKGEMFLMDSQRQEIANQLGPGRYIRDLGVGHVPWLVDPAGYASVLEQFWEEEETKQSQQNGKTLSDASPKSVVDVFDVCLRDITEGAPEPPKID